MAASAGGERELGALPGDFHAAALRRRAGDRADLAAARDRAQGTPVARATRTGRAPDRMNFNGETSCRRPSSNPSARRKTGKARRLQARPVEEGDQRPRLHPAELRALRRRRVASSRRPTDADAGDLEEADRRCSSRSARRACSTSRRSRARSPRTRPATSTGERDHRRPADRRAAQARDHAERRLPHGRSTRSRPTATSPTRTSSRRSPSTARPTTTACSTPTPPTSGAAAARTS